MKHKILTWHQFINHPRFVSTEGLCSNIRNILGVYNRNKFTSYLESKNYRTGYPIGTTGYLTYEHKEFGVYTYGCNKDNNTLYVGKQLELRKHLYKQFRVWSKLL